MHTLFGQVAERLYGALHLQAPAWNTVDWAAAALAVLALVAMLRFKIGMGWTLCGSGVLGVLWLLVVKGHGFS